MVKNKICNQKKINRKKGFISKNYSKISNLKYFVVDCLREEPHPSHYNLDKILNLVKEIKPKYTILTNLHSSMDYSMLKKKLPNFVYPAYDGMELIIN